MRMIVNDDRSGNQSFSGRVFMEREDTPWIRFRVDARSGVMTGVHLGSCEGSVPRATPFKMKFANGNEAVIRANGFAMLILAQISREDVYLEGSRGAGSDTAQSQLAAWEEFRGGGNGKEEIRQDRLEISKEDYGRHLQGVQHVQSSANGGLMIKRGKHLSVGAPLSGFDALKAINDPQSPGLTRPPGNVDVQGAREALAGVARPSSIAVAWYGQAPEESRKLRMQAAQAMPVLAGLIAESRDLSRAVDEMRPIQPVLTERTGLPKSAIKRIGKLTVPLPAGPIFEAGEAAAGEDALGVNRTRRFTVSGSVSVDKAMRHLSDMPPDRTPSSDAEWEAFHDVLTGCAIPLSNAFNIPVKETLSASKGNWVAYRDTLARAADFEPEAFDRRAMALTTIDAIQAVEGFSRTAVMPQVLASIQETEQPIPPVTAEFLGDAFETSARLAVGKSKNAAAHLFEVARRYASRIPAMMELEGQTVEQADERCNERFGEYGENAFPVLTETWTAPNDIVVAPLRNMEDLRKEGEAMRHCVGGYGRAALGASCHLYSIRTQAGERISTVELEGISGDDAVTAAANIRLRQNRGIGNRDPSDAAKSATTEFLKAVRNGTVPIQYEEILEWRRHRRDVGADTPARNNRAPVTTWESVLEHDWSSDETRQGLWEEWRTVMGGEIGKGPHPGVIYKDKGACDLVGAMSPRAAAILMEQARGDREEAPAP